MVYRVVLPAIDVDSVVRQAAALGIEGEVKEGDDFVLVRGSDADFTRWKNSSSFDYLTAAIDHAEPLAVVLTDEEYRRRAERFLTSSGLTKDTAEYRDTVHQKVELVEDGQGVEKTYMVTVSFGHTPLDGIPYDYGVGPRIRVHFGEGGQIVGAMSVWRDVEPFVEYPLRSIEEAVQAIEQGEGRLLDPTVGDTGTVTEVALAYISDPAAFHQESVLPWYVLSGRTTLDETFTAFVMAIASEYVQ